MLYRGSCLADTNFRRCRVMISRVGAPMEGGCPRVVYTCKRIAPFFVPIRRCALCTALPGRPLVTSCSGTSEAVHSRVREGQKPIIPYVAISRSRNMSHGSTWCFLSEYLTHGPAPNAFPSICFMFQERQHVMDAVLRLLNDSRSRFKALMLDLAKICHNEMTKDGLLAYFL